MSQPQEEIELGLGTPPVRLNGFPSLAHFIGGDSSEAIFRRFGDLSARNLLYLQSELHQLQAELREYDKDDASDIHNVAAQRRAREWASFMNDQSEVASSRRDLQSRIRCKIKEYRTGLGPCLAASSNRILICGQRKRSYWKARFSP